MDNILYKLKTDCLPDHAPPSTATDTHAPEGVKKVL
jgi:hypothetical protein